MPNQPRVVLWNPSSRLGKSSDTLRATLADQEQVTLIETETDDDIRRALDTAERINAVCLVAAGGDGTVNRAAAALAERNIPLPLGVLPMGTGNDFARSLGMPLEPLDAWRAILQGTSRDVDLIRVTGTSIDRVAANMVTGGNTAIYTHELTDDLKQRWGPFCYLRGALDVMTRLESFPIRYRLDDGTWESVTLLNFFLANGRTSGGGLAVAANASLSDQLLDVVFVREGSTVDLASLALNFAFSDFLEHELVTFTRGTKIELASDTPLLLSMDGDPVDGDNYWTVTNVPAAIQAIFAPESTATA